MSHSLLFAFRAVWLTVIGLETALLILLFVRRAFRGYPAFFSFVAFSVARSFLLLSTMVWHSTMLQEVRWMIYVPQLAILIAVVLEILYLVFHPFETLPKNTMGHFIGATASIALFAAAFAITHPGAQATAWQTFATAADQAVSWIICAIFMLLALFSRYFGIPWRHRAYGIGLGFLVYMTADVAVTTAITQLRLPPLSIFRLLDMSAFLVSCLIWGYYFFAREVERTAPTEEQVEEVRKVVGGFAAVLPMKER